MQSTESKTTGGSPFEPFEEALQLKRQIDALGVELSAAAQGKRTEVAALRAKYEGALADLSGLNVRDLAVAAVLTTVAGGLALAGADPLVARLVRTVALMSTFFAIIRLGLRKATYPARYEALVRAWHAELLELAAAAAGESR